MGSLLPVHAGVTYKDGDSYLKLGGRIQVQYHLEDPKSGSTTDTMVFRRLRPFIEGSVHKDWTGKFQWDMGNGDKVAIKDAYMQYKGFKNMKVTLGNANFQFSREFISSSKYQQFVERTFVGNHNYGIPDRQLGLHLTGNNSSKNFIWGVSMTKSGVDPSGSKSKLDFESVSNDPTEYEGWMVGGRVGFHPRGEVKYSQTDFGRGKSRYALELGAFTWKNDGDLTTAIDEHYDSVNAFELSGAYRGHGISVDIAHNILRADLTSTATSTALFTLGEKDTSIVQSSIEAGYLFHGEKWEIVAGEQAQNADGYESTWAISTLGFNYYINKQNTKIQFNYQINKNVGGVDGADQNDLYAMVQYVF